MAKWCNLYNCWCSDVDSILDDNEIECDQDCNNCENLEKIEPNH